MAAVARRVPLEVLCSALGVRERLDDIVAAVIAVAPAYPLGTDADQETAAGEPLELLTSSFHGTEETVANTIAVLVQACEATAGLIGNTLAVALRLPPAALSAYSVEALVDETLRYDPSARATQRQAAEAVAIDDVQLQAGATVKLDLAAACRDPAAVADPHRFDPGRPAGHQLAFGHGPRACPGSRHAKALAGSVVGAVLERCSLADCVIDYEPSPTLKVPSALGVFVG